MARVFLGLGSNIDPELNLRLAIDELEQRFGEVELSPVYQGPAIGFEGPDFLNLVAAIETDASPDAIHAEIEAIHTLAGRVREADSFSSRTLDIDLLLYDDLIVDEPPISLPRPDVLDYAFVLRPLVDLAPELRHPQTGKPLKAHWAAFNDASAPLTRADVIL